MPKNIKQQIWGSLDPFFEAGAVLGRKVANSWFLRSLFESNPFDGYHFFLAGKTLADTFTAQVQNEFPKIADKVTVFDRRQLPEMLAKQDYFCFHLSDCLTTQPLLTALRNEIAKSCFPISGLIHSLSYPHYSELFLRHLSPTTTARDAIVCSSLPGKEVVNRLFAMLRENYELSPERFYAPTLVHIPLGVTVGDFTARKPFDAPCRFLVFGRISHFSKMDLLPVLRAFQQLFARGVKKESVALTVAGWTNEGSDFLPSFKNLAHNIGLSLQVVECPNDEEKKQLFANSDVFLSVADNPQETFGLTILEAGAAGLPSIVSDYDGYRDLVQNGKTGICVPTISATKTPQIDRLAPLIFDSHSHLLLAQQTAVSIPKLAAAMQELIENIDKRLEMGEAAHKRVAREFTATTLIKKYLEMWENLWKCPVSPQKSLHPSSLQYGRIFGHYTTKTLHASLVLQCGKTGSAVYRKKDFVTIYAGIDRIVHPEYAELLAFLARNPIRCSELIANFQAKTKIQTEDAEYIILWALKHDILKVVEE